MVKFSNIVRVGCFDYEVVFPYKFVEADDRTAQHSFYDLDIKIADEHRRERNKNKLLVSFLHELIHAIDFSYSLLMFEEEHVNALSNLLFQFIKTNLNGKKWDIPKNNKINILGQEFRIIRDAKFEELDDISSYVDHDECVIYLSDIVRKESIRRAYVFMHIINCFENMLSLGLDTNKTDKFTFAFLDTMDRNNLWRLFK